MIFASQSRRNALGLLGAAVLALAGCGRKADPKPPPDADPNAPRRYPAPRGGAIPPPASDAPPASVDPVPQAPSLPPSFR